MSMIENKAKNYRYKKPVSANVDYFLEHAEEMIADTEHVLNPTFINIIELDADGHKYEAYIQRSVDLWRKSHVEHDMMFGRGKFYLSPGETDLQAGYRMAHDYCEATGRWDFFVWEDIPEDQRDWYIKE